MFLKSLTLKGFKSFAEATTMELEPGVTVVVAVIDVPSLLLTFPWRTSIVLVPVAISVLDQPLAKGCRNTREVGAHASSPARAARRLAAS